MKAGVGRKLVSGSFLNHKMVLTHKVNLRRERDEEDRFFVFCRSADHGF
jgi:hypothetical protein